jgi:hypothetical protein
MGFVKGQKKPERGSSKGLAWLRDASTYEGDDCLLWPFFIDPRRGYGVLAVEGQMKKAHRVMCEMVNGPPPEGHEAAHSCGKGREGCCTPKHLSWKTRTANQGDRRVHGTAGNGGNGKRRKLTIDQVIEIRAKQGIETVTSLADRFGVDRSAIRQVQLGKVWKNMNGSIEQDRILKIINSAEVPLQLRDIEAMPELADIKAPNATLGRLVRKGLIRRVRRGQYAALAQALEQLTPQKGT